MKVTITNVGAEPAQVNFYDFENVQYPCTLGPGQSVDRQDFLYNSPFNPGVECKSPAWELKITTEEVEGQALMAAYVNEWFPPPKRSDYAFADGNTFKGGGKGINIIVMPVTDHTTPYEEAVLTHGLKDEK